METLIDQLLAHLIKTCQTSPEILTDEGGASSSAYEKSRQVFNTKFQLRPSAIILVENSAQVSEIVKFANRFPTKISLRARSGGHDHEAECSGTDTWVIDFSKMNQVQVDEGVAQADGSMHAEVSIQPGARFLRVKSILDQYNLSIAHGTCETVAVAGYTMGGGWGPWTRLHGMGCERLIGATIVLGDGEILPLSRQHAPDSREGKLLWALRGGGGFSYGIVTELRFLPFELPAETHSFHVNFNTDPAKPERPAIEVLKIWESAIAGENNPALIGTNLKIVAAHLPAGQAPDPAAPLECTFNGYYAGTEQEIRDFVANLFGSSSLRHYGSAIHHGRQVQLGSVSKRAWRFDSWDRHRKAKPATSFATSGSGLSAEEEIDPSIALETEGPAPHKITSRLVNAAGWDDSSRAALICALQSSLVPPLSENDPNDQFAIQQYITLGAISGPYYARPHPEGLPLSFPYCQRPFTLQFQAWWDQFYYGSGKLVPGAEAVLQSQTLANRKWENRAEDWIEECRNAEIPHTSGAFISFKDSAVTTPTYFSQSYDGLRAVKTDCSADQNLLLRTRKTII